MIAVANHKTVPFFDRVPVRASAAMCRACHLIELPSQNADSVYMMLNAELRLVGVEGPGRQEFNIWYEEVKLGRFTSANYEESALWAHPQYLPVKEAMERNAVKQPFRIASALAGEAVDMDTVLYHPPAVDVMISAGEHVAREVAKLAERDIRLEQARAIVEAANRLFEAKIAAGHSPLSVSIEDTIVAEALRTLLTADGEGIFAEATSNALDTALTLLQGGSIEQQDKLLDILTMDMQQELCRELIKQGTLSGFDATDNKIAWEDSDDGGAIGSIIGSDSGHVINCYRNMRKPYKLDGLEPRYFETLAEAKLAAEETIQN